MNQAEALLLSLVLEVPVALGLVLGAGWRPRGAWLRVAVVAAACTLLTHPLAWNGWQWLRGALSWSTTAAVVEGLVVGVEALLYGWLLPLPPLRALVLALVANAFSFGIGLVIIRLVLA